MVQLLRHRPTKGSATDRLNLNHRVTPRLHKVEICPRDAQGHIPTRRHPGMWQRHSPTLPHSSGPGCARRRKRLPWRTCYSYRYTMVHAPKGKTEILGKRSPAMKRCAILIFASVLSLSVRAGAQGAEKIHELKSSPKIGRAHV